MRSMWGDDSRREIKDRVARVTPDCKAQWGKLSAPQMVCHLAESLKMALGEPPVERKRLPIRYPPPSRGRIDQCLETTRTDGWTSTSKPCPRGSKPSAVESAIWLTRRTQ